MTVVYWLAYSMLGTGALLALVRLARGPSLLDRVVATDTVLVIVAAGLGVHAALQRDPTVVPVLVVVSLLAFVGAVSVARYVGGMQIRQRDDERRDDERRDDEQVGERPTDAVGGSDAAVRRGAETER